MQTRIVGCLIEKELATPDNYPLTMNALLAACNQTSNRTPVTKLEEATVSNALENLRAANVVRIVYSRSNRADKFRHVLDELLALERDQLAVLCVMMLRGPQTLNELRTRTERLYPFETLDDVDRTLGILATRDEPLAARIERRPGQKETRWVNLLGADLAEVLAAEEHLSDDARSRPRGDRLGAIEESVAELRSDLDQLIAAHRRLVARLGETDDDPDA